MSCVPDGAEAYAQRLRKPCIVLWFFMMRLSVATVRGQRVALFCHGMKAEWFFVIDLEPRLAHGGGSDPRDDSGGTPTGGGGRTPASALSFAGFLCIFASMNVADFSLLRTELLLGAEAMGRLARARVIIFGVGGVGSWCAESLVRSGLGSLTIVDADTVCATNLNRQLMATRQTVGRVKVDALRERLLSIRPEAEVVPLQKVYSTATAGEFDLDAFDVVIDAIDSLADKAELILNACRGRAALFSSMGAALKMDPSQIRVAEFANVYADPLARALRKKFKALGVWPAREFSCVFSPERLDNRGADDLMPHVAADASGLMPPRARANGTVAHVTAIFGFTLAGLALRAIVGDV